MRNGVNFGIGVGLRAALLLPMYVQAYDEPTHQILSANAAQRSVLATDPGLLSDLNLIGLNSGQFPQFIRVPPSLGAVGTPLDDIRWGALYEDDLINNSGLCLRAICSNSFNHFFDPQWNGGLGRPLTVTGQVLGNTSPDWIIADGQFVPDGQYFSLRQAQAKYFDALTLSSAADRNAAFGFVFQSLGHLMHHIQDMAQPQHVRNEPHIHTGIIEAATARYEIYTTANVNPTLEYNLSNVWPRYAIPSFSLIRQYWSSNDTGSYLGMADFTSRNYVTFHNPLTVDSTGSIGSSAEFPLPGKFNKDGTAKYVSTETRTYASKSKVGSSVTASAAFIIGDIGDDWLAPASNNGKRVAAESAAPLITDQSVSAKRAFGSESPDVWEDNYPVLLPRAVAFSAGLINHFFRGRIGFARDSGTSWKLSNPTTYQMTGNYYVFQEDGSGTRTQVLRQFADLAPGAVIYVTIPEPPASTAKMVAAFSGTVGSENGRVAGKIATYVPPTPVVACAGPFYDSFSTHNFGSVNGARTAPNSSYKDSSGLQLGSTAGVVTVSIWINPYSVYALNSAQYAQYLSSPFAPGSAPNFPVSAMSETISGKSGTNTNLFSKRIGGQSAANTFTFSYDPVSTGSTLLSIHEAYPVYAYADTSAQEAATVDIIKQVSCPGKGLDDVNKGLRTISVGITIPIGYGSCGQWTFSVNGSPNIYDRGFAVIPIGAQTHIATSFNGAAFPSCPNLGQSNPTPGVPYYTDGGGKHAAPFPSLVTIQ